MSNKSDKLRNAPIGKLLLGMALPAVFSMLIQSLYNIVDSIYIAQLGQDALFSLGLVFPLQMLSLSIGIGCGVGTNAILARRLGQRRLGEANITANTGLLLAVFHGIVLMVFGIFVTKPFLALFTDNLAVIQMGSSYLWIILGFSLGQQVQMVCERLLQATGNMVMPMVSLLIAALTNIILDPILIFGYFGIPARGVIGAAIATAIGQWLGMIFILYILIKKDHEIKVGYKDYKLSFLVIKDIYKIGIPTMIMNAIGSITTTFMNGILVALNVVAVNALSIYFKVQSFVFMPVFGMTQGAMPILAYNYGAKNKERFMQTLKLMLIASLSMMGIGMIIMLGYPQTILGLFKPSGELILIGTQALRILGLCFIFVGFNVVIINAFQSLGASIYSMSMSILRQLVLLIPMAYIFSKLFGLSGVWFAYPIAEVIVLLCFAPIVLRKIKQKFSLS